MKSLLDALEGRKTYLIAAIAILYLLGGDLGWWPINDIILGLLGFGGLATLRRAVARPSTSFTSTLCLGGLAAAVLLTGCSTLDGKITITPARVEAVTRLAAYGSAKALMLRSPDMRADIENASLGFSQLRKAETWDITSMCMIAAANGLGELASEEGTLILTGIGLFEDAFFGGTVRLDKQEYARAVVIGADDGLRLALGPATRGPLDQVGLRLKMDAAASRAGK